MKKKTNKIKTIEFNEAAFKAFVKTISAVTGQKVTLNQAKKNLSIVKAFSQTQEMIESGAKNFCVNPKSTSVSTKRASYNALNIPKLDADILSTLKKAKQASRAEIAEKGKYRLSTVCGAINRLSKLGLVKVIAVTKDFNSMRKVELLKAK